MSALVNCGVMEDGILVLFNEKDVFRKIGDVTESDQFPLFFRAPLTMHLQKGTPWVFVLLSYLVFNAEERDRIKAMLEARHRAPELVLVVVDMEDLDLTVISDIARVRPSSGTSAGAGRELPYILSISHADFMEYYDMATE